MSFTCVCALHVHSNVRECAFFFFLPVISTHKTRRQHKTGRHTEQPAIIRPNLHTVLVVIEDQELRGNSSQCLHSLKSNDEIRLVMRGGAEGGISMTACIKERHPPLESRSVISSSSSVYLHWIAKSGQESRDRLQDTRRSIADPDSGSELVFCLPFFSSDVKGSTDRGSGHTRDKTSC